MVRAANQIYFTGVDACVSTSIKKMFWHFEICNPSFEVRKWKTIKTDASSEPPSRFLQRSDSNAQKSCKKK